MVVVEIELFRRTVLQTARFVYEQSFKLMLISIGWFLCSLPMVTIGVATIGAYAAIVSLQETGDVNGPAVRRVVRETFVPALILGWIPGLLTVLWVLNVDRFVRTGEYLSLGLSFVTLYALLYGTLVLVGVYLELLEGCELWIAFKHSNVWVISNPVMSVLTAGASLAILIVTAVLTVAFVLLFPALTFSLQIYAYENTRDSGCELSS